MTLNEAIVNRRSIRSFTDYEVTDTEILSILEAARMAPSWANTQVWEFIVIRDKKLINQITENYSPNNPARPCSFEASVLIVGCIKTKVAGYRKEKARTKFGEWGMFDLGMAVQNMSLKAHELGLGSVVVGSMNHDKLNELLDLPAGYEAICTLPIGMPITTDVKVPRRKEKAEFVHLNKFGTKMI